MEHNENLTPQELELEDILREFGDETAQEAPTQSGVEQILREFADDPDSIVHLEDEPAPITADTLPADPVTADTVRMDPVTEDTVRIYSSGSSSSCAVTGDTIRMGQVVAQAAAAAAAMSGDTVRMDPITDETVRLNTADLPKSQVRMAQPIEEEPEAFTGDWEPEYEQPMGSYNPPPPIIVHPRSRLRELKRKLVAGPERRYYELSGRGAGRMQAAIFFSLLVVLISTAATVLYTLDMIPENRMRLMVFSQCFTMLLSAALGCNRLLDGIGDLFRGRPSLNTLLVFSFLACSADAVLCLQQLRVPCCAAFSMQVTLSLWGNYQKYTAELGQMDTLRKAIHLNGVGACDDYYEGRKGLLRMEGQVEHFMDQYAKRSTTEKILGWYGLFALVASAALGVVAYLYYGLSAAFQAAAAAALAAAPAIAFVSQTRPMAILERRLHKLGSVICGPIGVKGLSGKAVVPVTHADLFPAGTVKMNGVKFFGNRRPEEIVACCTALIAADDSGLTSLFRQVADSRNAPHYDVKDLIAYENGGLGGVVRGQQVLVGSLSCLQSMGVAIPEGIRVNQAVCVAIDGQLCGLFAVTHEKAKAAAAGLATICNGRRLRPVVAQSDFAMTDELLRQRFGSHTRKILYPTQEQRAQLRAKQLPEDAPALLLSTKDGFAPVAYAITGARALRRANIAGLVIALTAGLLGLAMMAALVLLDAMVMLTPANMVAYQLVWIVPGWIASARTRIL